MEAFLLFGRVGGIFGRAEEPCAMPWGVITLN